MLLFGHYLININIKHLFLINNFIRLTNDIGSMCAVLSKRF